MSNVSRRLMCLKSLGKFWEHLGCPGTSGSLRIPLPSSFLYLLGPSPQAPSTSKLGWVFQVDHKNRKGRETRTLRGFATTATSSLERDSLSLTVPSDDGVPGLCHPQEGFLFFLFCFVLDSTSIIFSKFQKLDQSSINFLKFTNFQIAKCVL